MKTTGIKIVLTLAAIAASSPAFAVSAQVKAACRGDYFAYCSQHSVGSAGLSQCMRANAKQLSGGCKSALVAAGYAGRKSTAMAKN